jgi:hypothetical protein
MRPFCEVVVKEVLPAIRSILAKELKDSGMTQDEIAKALGITQASVSHYLKQSRGKNVRMLSENPELKKRLKETAAKIKEKKANPVLEFCVVCKDVRKEIICKFHKQSTPGLKTCDICFTMDVCK